ncbi:outer membrane beta-barrel protein [Aquiflexum gelatinilyticum]|uniref:Outer membrane beta-barrel protein n=1 Tax=Aquiflexum gelatinilyticum TaxID=2961943 RepID=A0A9X2SZ33_9BACT|nr:outer membrane beta-barrel protein [Aquiflexum gelatinilyticum]MCR9013491.1 outer membrane beta-barrel protein [Aquiflexum gelatinilyticum]
MKKYLLLFCFLGLVQFAFGSTDREFLAPKDTIIVEFGTSGKIVLVVDNKEDFERLKKMNINQIISELDLQIDEKTGELVVVEVSGKNGSREIVKVTEDWNKTEVSVAGIRILVDETSPNTRVKVETGVKKKSDPPFRTYFGLDLGLNNYLDNNGQFPKSTQPYAVRGWGSWNVGLNFFASQKISKGFRFDLGMGVQWYNFKFENRDFQAVRGEDAIEFIQRNDVAGFKSKISASYLTTMGLFKLDFGRMNDQGRRGIRLALGPYAGYRLGGTSKYVYRPLDGGGRRKEHLNTGIFLNNFRYGIRGEVGFGRVNFFTTYDFNQLFQAGKGPELNPITFGIIF